MTTVSEFVSEISGRGLARQNRFLVEIPNVNFWPGGDENLLSLLCQSASLPGATIAVKKQNLFGPAYIRPASINYGETLAMTFLCDQEMWIKRLFDLWMHRVVNLSSFTVNYKNEYARDIVISQLDTKENATYQVKLIDAFPVSMGAMALNQSALDRFHLLPMTFAYRYWETDLVSNSEIFDISFESTVEKLKEIVPKIPIVQPPTSVEDANQYTGFESAFITR
jgi:hypothetical protein